MEHDNDCSNNEMLMLLGCGCDTLCFSPWREEGLGEAPAGEQGAEESVQGESEFFKGIRMPRLQLAK